MPRPPKDVTDTELAVLRELWSHGACTIRRLTEILYPGGGTAHYATVQKLLERLEQKRCVRRESTARAHLFEATVDRDDLIARRLQETADKLCEGSLTPLLTQLASEAELSREDISVLRKLVRKLSGEGE